ncbi:hypothetical protein C8024_11105 [Sphingopyxis sp. BSNA05]|nr:hypothetical protein [Sphingopyxis sp. BSNA05]
MSLWPLLVVAIATSIDAAVAGITLPSIGAPILLACAVIGLTTAVLTYPGVYLGALVGTRIGKSAEMLGGLILIGLGIKIFVVQQFLAGDRVYFFLKPLTVAPAAVRNSTSVLRCSRRRPLRFIASVRAGAN